MSSYLSQFHEAVPALNIPIHSLHKPCKWMHNGELHLSPYFIFETTGWILLKFGIGGVVKWLRNQWINKSLYMFAVKVCWVNLIWFIFLRYNIYIVQSSDWNLCYDFCNKVDRRKQTNKLMLENLHSLKCTYSKLLGISAVGEELVNHPRFNWSDKFGPED